MTILCYLFAVEALAFATLPLAFFLFPKFADRGFGLAKILGLLLASYLTWLFCSLKIAPFSQATILAVTLFLTLFSWLFFRLKLILGRAIFINAGGF